MATVFLEEPLREPGAVPRQVVYDCMDELSLFKGAPPDLLRREEELLAGFCYTQFTDTYQETNGLLYFDRRPKLPIEQIALATRGSR